MDEKKTAAVPEDGADAEKAAGEEALRGVSVIIEDGEQELLTNNSAKFSEKMRAVLSSVYMASLASLVTLNGIFFIFAGYRWTVAVPLSVSLIITAAALWITYFDARTKAAFEPRGLFLLSLSVKIQKVICFVFAGFFLIYTAFAFIGLDILLGAAGGFYGSLSSLGLWIIPLFLLTAFSIYSANRYLWRKSMLADNFRDAAEYGFVFSKGSTEYAGLCVTLAVCRLAFYIIKPESYLSVSFMPEGPAAFLDSYGVGGGGGAVELICVILNVILLVYTAVLSVLYYTQAKNFKKIKKALDKRKKL
ncbi:MAG: hypothetical protein IJS94_04265 [Clostridia bacterium]|nr:hypothetical protein [Clostridia bacterium]